MQPLRQRINPQTFVITLRQIAKHLKINQERILNWEKWHNVLWVHIQGLGGYTNSGLTTPFFLTNHSRHRVHRGHQRREKEKKGVIDEDLVLLHQLPLASNSGLPLAVP